ncbi:sulfatase-like hydrolase/transferase [Aquirufa sp. Wall-65K1]
MKKYLILAFLTLSSTLWGISKPLKSQRPNVILILMDDLGYGDLSCYGALQYETPNIDRLAHQGIRFTNYLSAQAVCSASRAGILTGCYPNRLGISGALFPNAPVGLNPEEETIAELLKDQGYATGIFGKWHLGDKKEFLPLQHGFDEYVGIPYSNDMWPVDLEGKPITKLGAYKQDLPILSIFDGNEPSIYLRNLKDQEQITRVLTQRSIQFIEKNKNKPFFVYLPHSMPHVPIAASPEFQGKSKQGLYGDMMLEIDWSIGEIIKTLKKNHLEENTLVIFTSDNGPWLNYGNHAGSTQGLREGKGTTYEGGQRVPFIAYWKGKIQAGQISNQLAAAMDVLPTIAQVTQSKLPKKKIDGVSLWPILQGIKQAEPRKNFLYYYRKNNLEAVRKGDWKLVLPHPGRTYEGFLPGNNGLAGQVNENAPIQQGLFDLRRDPGERYDVQAQYPEKVKELLLLADEARSELGDDIKQIKGKENREIGHIKKPNVVYIYADDLGYGELGAYGQKIIKTPYLDALAKQGIKFTQHYTSAPVCAPARCMLLTGKHAGHAQIRGNHELGGFTDETERGQMPLEAQTFTLGNLMKNAGYKTAAIGKWGLGMANGTGNPNAHGFDYFYGLLDQKQAHNYYPTHLWENGKWDTLKNKYLNVHEFQGKGAAADVDFQQFQGKEYVVDKMMDKALNFVEKNKSNPFFLYLPLPLPHLSLQAPEEAVKPYLGAFPDSAYLGKKGYTPNAHPRATYAGMISYLDKQVGRLVASLKNHKIDTQTIIFFSSDNGATFDVGGVDTEFFNSTAGLRGRKQDVYEGGIREPLIVSWPGVIPGGQVSHLPSVQYDMMATLAELTGQKVADTDGVSFLPTILKKGEQKQRPFIYFEFPEKTGQVAIRIQQWKGVKSNLKKNRQAPWEIYDLEKDPFEAKNVADQHPELIPQLDAILKREHNAAKIPSWEIIN